MNYTTWAKSNKKMLVLKIIGDVDTPPQTKPVAVFLAGIPGAGKTEFIKRLLGDNPTVVKIDLDEIVKLFPKYNPKQYYKYRTAANIIVDECVIYCRKHSLNFVLDGTFGYGKAIDNIKSALKRHEVVIVYIWKDPAEAWQLTKDRELVTDRAIDRVGFLHSCDSVPKNLIEVRKTFDKQISMIAIKKDSGDTDFQMTRDLRIIDDLLQNSYNKETLEGLIT